MIAPVSGGPDTWPCTGFVLIPLDSSAVPLAPRLPLRLTETFAGNRRRRRGSLRNLSAGFRPNLARGQILSSTGAGAVSVPMLLGNSHHYLIGEATFTLAIGFVGRNGNVVGLANGEA